MDILAAIEEHIRDAIDDARVEVRGGAGGGHFEITVRSMVFEGKNRLQKQRLVLKAIAPLMAGDAAPVHAVDKLETLTE
jgi:acid stress-induced BolA-like protein IbaG/YrbA